MNGYRGLKMRARSTKLAGSVERARNKQSFGKEIIADSIDLQNGNNSAYL